MKIMKALSLALLLLLPLFSLSGATVVQSDISGYIRADAHGYFTVDTFFVGDNGINASNRSLNGILQFDLSGVDVAGRQLSKVSLVLTVSSTSNTTESTDVVTFQLYTLKNAVDASATWLRAHDGEGGLWQKPGATGDNDRGALVSSVSLATSDYSLSAGGTGKIIVFDSSSSFLAEVQGALDGDGTLGFWLGLDERDVADGERHALRFASNLHATVNYRPRLVLEWEPIPEPSTLGFLAVGSGLLLGLLKRSRHKGGHQH